MLLQDAVILGDTLKKCDSRQWLSPDGSCGCALGGALLAAGVTLQDFNRQRGMEINEMPCLINQWPWLTRIQINRISKLYFRVEGGLATIEDVAAYIRTVEPIEPQATPEPSEAQHEAVAVGCSCGVYIPVQCGDIS